MKKILDHLLSYSIEDFIPMDAESYQRLFERVNESFWPWHLLSIGVGIATIYLLLQHKRQRFAWPLLTIMWLVTAYQFHWRFFAELNWAASYFAMGFIVQGLTLSLLFFASTSTSRDSRQFKLTRACGISLIVFAILIYPFLSLLSNRGWAAAEVFGVAPDPTALATIGALLLTRRWWLMPIPLLWLIISGAIMYSLNS